MAAEWRNWAGDQRCRPAAIERPRDREELIAAVRRAKEAGHSVRVAGSGHSFTDIALTDGVLLCLDRLDRVLATDAERGLVKVEAGIVLGELNRRLDEHGLAFENLGDIDRQTLAGSISTATHGTGTRFVNLSAQIASIELVGADGDLREISAESDPELFRAARVGLGALGRDLLGDDPDRPRVHAQPRRLAEAARRGARQPRRAQPDRPLRVLRLPPHRDRALPREPADRRAAEPALPGRGLRAGGRARELGRRARRRRRPHLPEPGARAGEARVEGGRPLDQGRPLPQGLRLRAADPVHRDGVLLPARARGRGRARACSRSPAARSSASPSRSRSASSPPTTRI